MQHESLFPLPAPTVTLADEIKSLTRELGLRRSVYARRVADGKMSQAQADREIACTEATLARLQTLPRWVEAAVSPPPAGWHGLAGPSAQPILEETCFAYERGGRLCDAVVMLPDPALLYWLSAPGLFFSDTWFETEPTTTEPTTTEPTADELRAIRQAGHAEVKEALRQQESTTQAGGGRVFGQDVIGAEGQGNG